MAYIYAELDENNICCAVSELSGEVITDTMIPLETYDTSLLGMKYVDGAWEEVPQEPTPEPEPTELEVLKNEVTDLQLALVEQYEVNLALQEEITNTQMALVELYEGVM